MNIFKKVVPTFILIILAAGLLFPVANCSAGLLSSSTASGIAAQTGALNSNAGFDTGTKLENVVATVIGVVLGLLGIIFLVLLILAGYQWMTAGGNEDQVKKATARIKTAIIGLVIVLAAYAITAFIFNNLPFNAGSQDSTPDLGNEPVDD